MELSINENYKSNLKEQFSESNKVNGNIIYKSYSDYQKEFEERDKKISEEEDNILYEYYKKTFFAYVNNKTFEIYKSRIISFPPATAPGIVRKTWREMMEKATPEEKLNMMSFGDLCMIDLEKVTSKSIPQRKMPKDFSGYLNIVGFTKEYISKYYDIPEVGRQVYESLVDIGSRFEAELQKYMSCSY